jgi:hypothetical protein
MATFGNTAAQTTVSFPSAGYINGFRYTLSEAGTVTSISLRVSGSGSAEFAIYSTAGVRQGYTSAVALGAINWYTANITSGGQLAAGDYFICFNVDGASDQTRSDAGATPYSYHSQAYNADPSITFPANTTLTDGGTLLYSLYATYTPAGWTHIAKVDGITATSVAKVNGIAVASIAKVNGIAV